MWGRLGEKNCPSTVARKWSLNFKSWAHRAHSGQVNEIFRANSPGGPLSRGATRIVPSGVCIFKTELERAGPHQPARFLLQRQIEKCPGNPPKPACAMARAQRHLLATEPPHHIGEWGRKHFAANSGAGPSSVKGAHPQLDCANPLTLGAPHAPSPPFPPVGPDLPSEARSGS